MVAVNRNTVNIGLPSIPETQNKELFTELVRIYNALNILAQGLDSYTADGTLTATVALKAPIASPAFTGDPIVPTPALADNDFSIANTGWVKSQNYITAASIPVTSVFGRTGAITLLAADVTTALTYTPARLAGLSTQDFAIQALTLGSLVGGIAKSGSFIRNSGTGAGNVAYTGVGFKPSFIIFICAIDTQPETCFGAGTVAGGRSLYGDSANNHTSYAKVIHFLRITDLHEAVISSFDADGFTLAWTHTGSGTSSDIICNYIAFR